jgi:hypothetical protein
MISLKSKNIINQDIIKCKHIKRILPWTNLRQTDCFWCEWEMLKKSFDPPITPPSSPRLRIIN